MNNRLQSGCSNSSYYCFDIVGRPHGFATDRTADVQSYAVLDVVALGDLGLIVLAADSEDLRIACTFIGRRCLEVILSVDNFASNLTKYALDLRALATQFCLLVTLAVLLGVFHRTHLLRVVVIYVSL